MKKENLPAKPMPETDASSAEDLQLLARSGVQRRSFLKGIGMAGGVKRRGGFDGKPPRYWGNRS